MALEDSHGGVHARPRAAARGDGCGREPKEMFGWECLIAGPPRASSCCSPAIRAGVDSWQAGALLTGLLLGFGAGLSFLLRHVRYRQYRG